MRRSFSSKFKYAFDNFMSRGGFSVFMALLFLFVCAFVLMSIVRYISNLLLPEAEPISILDQLWVVFLQISDAGAVAEDGDFGVLNKISGIVTIFLGLVLFSSLVAFITSQFEAKLEDLRKGKSDVIEDNHTLILGFGDRVLEIIRELIIANESEKSPAIVVLSDREKDEMDEFFRDHVEDSKTTRIVCRSGLTSSRRMLEKVSLQQAKSVVILNDSAVDADEEEKALSDSRVLKTIMAVISCTGEENIPPLIAEIHLENKRKLAETISPAIHCIEEHSLLAKLIVQTSRTAGLANVYDAMVGFDGSEFYFYAPPHGWGEKTYSEIMFHFSECCLLGLRKQDGTVLVNPPADTVFQDGDEALLLAEDDSAISWSKTAIAFATPNEAPAGAQPQGIEHQLIVGWSRKAAVIVDEYSQYLIDGSSIDVITSDPDEDMLAELKELDQKYPQININLIRQSINDSKTLALIKPEKYNNVIILKKDGGEAELRDSETISTLLEFRHYFRQHNGAIKTQLISEVADSENTEVIQEVGVRDFLISNKFVSKMYAQASEDPEILKVYDELFKEEGSEIYIKPASLFYSNFPVTVSFADISAATSRRGESCFGVRIKSEEKDHSNNQGFHINPAKKARFTLTEKDFLITLAEDES
ncbi:MAG: hypothetical protein KDK39_03880 [Leptospiraceae bacterium]|nr:hypothetical protein [Leptospiraceae bacterium]